MKNKYFILILACSRLSVVGDENKKKKTRGKTSGYSSLFHTSDASLFP